MSLLSRFGAGGIVRLEWPVCRCLGWLRRPGEMRPGFVCKTCRYHDSYCTLLTLSIA
jgi:hypothetical protein